MKAQLVVEAKTKRIVASAIAPGRTHDFSLFKASRVAFAQETECLADSGYQGLWRYHANSQTPKKKSKHCPLSAADRAANRVLARRRIVNEQVIGRLKVFKILSHRYRNRRRRFGLRFNLIAGIYNFEL